MIVFKLERERPAYTVNLNESLFYVKDKYVRTCEFASSRDIPILSIRSKSSSNGKIRGLSYSAPDKAIILTSVHGIPVLYSLCRIPMVVPMNYTKFLRMEETATMWTPSVVMESLRCS